ncbi:MAG: hypothetical protein ACMG55_10620 [Microcoleus sp.]
MKLPDLLTSIKNITSGSFINVDKLIDRRISECDTLYYLSDEHDALVCFYFVATPILHINGGPIKTLFLGLSASREEVKGSALVVQLYEHALKDKSGQMDSRGLLHCWSVAVNPSVYLAARQYFDSVEPRLDGSYSSEGRSFAKAAREYLRFGLESGDGHPFLLKGIALSAPLNRDELYKMSKISGRRSMKALLTLGFNIHNGDGLLFYGKIKIR